MRVVEASEWEARWGDLVEIERTAAVNVAPGGRRVSKPVREATSRGDEIFRALENIHTSLTSELASPTRYP
jgi:hypothetical protein